jgi:hypothetical protein
MNAGCRNAGIQWVARAGKHRWPASPYPDGVSDDAKGPTIWARRPALMLVAGLVLALVGTVWTVRFVGHVGDLLVTRYSGVRGVLVFDECEARPPAECRGLFRADDGSLERAGVTVEVGAIPDPRAEAVPAHLQRGSGYGYSTDVSIGSHVILLTIRLVVLGAGVWIMRVGRNRLRSVRRLAS